MAAPEILQAGEVINPPKGPFWKRSDREKISALLTALLGIQIKGTKGSVHISGRNIILQFGDTVASDGGLGMVYTQEFDELVLTEYKAGEVTRVSPDNDAATTKGGPTLPGVYICVATPDETDFPKNPIQDGGENVAWNWLSTWPSEKMDCIAGNPATVITDSQIKPPDDGI